ncbi:MAG: MotA/TolQ/ExbB proton channel family protein [Planctomycetota bacterium]|jgi:biopolymer transport protein ExbB
MLRIIVITLLLAGQPVEESKPAKPAAPATAAETSTDQNATPQQPEAKDGRAAEVPAQSSEDDVHILRSGAIGLLLRGGFFMWPILIMGIVASGVIIERYRSLRMLTTDSGEVRIKVRELLHADSVEKAMKLCDREQGPVPAILMAGLRKFLVLRRLGYDPAKIEEQVVKAMDDYSSHIVAALERHLPILATVSSVAPMLGFLGTVHGMIVAFDDIVAKMGETNIVEAAAGGISVALLTTCFGLIVGIPAFMAFNYFTSVINRFVLQVEESATDLIETVTLHMALKRRRPPRPPVRSPQPPSKGTV